MPKKKKPEEKPEEQFKRFQETAKELGVDAEADVLDQHFRKLSKSTASRSSSPKSGQSSR